MRLLIKQKKKTVLRSTDQFFYSDCSLHQVNIFIYIWGEGGYIEVHKDNVFLWSWTQTKHVRGCLQYVLLFSCLKLNIQSQRLSIAPQLYYNFQGIQNSDVKKKKNVTLTFVGQAMDNSCDYGDPGTVFRPSLKNRLGVNFMWS